jgi:hypothetical protein
MSMLLTSPVTGGAQTGFTAPTYTLVADTAPDVNGRQFAVSALGGTQAGVTVHSVAAPFTFLVSRPKVFKNLGKANPITNVVKDVPMNIYRGIIRKGVIPLAGQPYQIALIRVEFHVPAGSDTADAANLRAMCSLAIGGLNQLSAGTGDSLLSGII